MPKRITVHSLERDMIKMGIQLIEWSIYLLILTFVFSGCSRYQTDVTNSVYFKRSMAKFEKLEQTRCFQFNAQNFTERMVGPVPKTQFEWQQYRKRRSIYGKYLK